MGKKGLSLVPDDLLIRVSRAFKDQRPEFGDTVGQHITDCLEAMELPGGQIDIVKARRILVIAHLAPELLAELDKIASGGWNKAEKALMGVWQGRVESEAVWGKVVCLADDLWKSHRVGSKKEKYLADMARLYGGCLENLEISDEVRARGEEVLKKCLVMVGADPEGQGVGQS